MSVENRIPTFLLLVPMVRRRKKKWSPLWVILHMPKGTIVYLAKEGDGVVNQDVLLPVLNPEKQDNTGVPSTLMSNRVTSQDYNTLILHCWWVTIL
jgi:hypothetical protein